MKNLNRAMVHSSDSIKKKYRTLFKINWLFEFVLIMKNCYFMRRNCFYKNEQKIHLYVLDEIVFQPPKYIKIWLKSVLLVKYKLHKVKCPLFVSCVKNI